ncbi:methyl-accepting chemotaxis protein [Castellaniella sp.]|uniref:methyl-accepting chemotaxis protein n=1 Tax=Castellaniella sp. TaxID=1955812 RepID=UPI002AFDFCD8|nr:methyl-accepting chemotaxis protein [Castellaniella sp.]
MKNLKIGTRLALGFGVVILLLVVLSSIGFWRILDSNTASANLRERQQINTLVLQWARQAETNTSLALGAANMNDPEARGRAETGMAKSDEAIMAARKALQAHNTQPEFTALFKQASTTQDVFFAGRKKAFEDLENWEIGRANDFFNHEMPKLTQTLIQQVDQLATFQQGLIDQINQETQSSNQLGLMVLITATLLALLISPLLAWRTTRSITHPMHNAIGLAEAVAQRDLSHEIHATGKDEIAQLLRALGRMEDSLRSAVGEVRSGANSIASAASEISAGNLDLSSRTEQQASSLAQTAATMEQITATVRQNADNTQQANTLAATAAQTASSGGSLVAELVGTMGEINSKSQQVADIIGVIDSIAFQTNILALNAAVEAARAGEQGRGFAVVAAEVRALAQRSAGAAKEIKDLIDSSVQATTKGNEQAAHAGDTMQEIVSSINRVTDIMGEINAANREQTTGIEEINTAITQMDDATRQNASLVEESAAAATSLQAQADNLASLVATFNLGQHSSAAQSAGAARQQRSHTGSQTRSGTGAHQQPSGQAARMPSAPEKVISPAPGRAPRTAQAPAAPASASSRPALRAPGKPAPATADTQEWTEF